MRKQDILTFLFLVMAIGFAGTPTAKAGLTICNPSEDSLAVAVASGQTVSGWYLFEGQACRLVIEEALSDQPVQISVVSNTVSAESVLGGDFVFCVLWLRRFSLAQDDSCRERGRRLLGFYTVPTEGELDLTYTLPKDRFGTQIASTNLNLSFFGRWKPDLGFQAADGSPIDITEFRGKWVLLLYWADWCGPCITALAKLDQLRKTMGGERVAVVAVHSAEEKSLETALEVFRESEVESIGLYFENADYKTPRSLANHLGTIESKSMPSLSILDPEGRLIAVHEGDLTESLLTFLENLFGAE